MRFLYKRILLILSNRRVVKQSKEESFAERIERNAEIDAALFMIENNMEKQGIDILKKHS